MPQAYVCPDCGTRYSRRLLAERGERCRVCHGRKQPLVYWRVVGVALGTTALLLITLIFALKAWADNRKSGGPMPRAEEPNLLPVIVERPVESANSQPEVRPKATQKEQPQPQKESPPNESKGPAKPPTAPVPPPSKPEATKTEIASKPGTKEQAEPPLEKAFKRLDFRSEEELRKELVQVPIFQKKELPVQALRQLASAPKDRKFAPDEMPDFAGLPMRMGVDCQLGKEPAENLQVLSGHLRTFMTAAIRKEGNDPRPNPEVLRKCLLGDPLRQLVAMQIHASGRDIRFLDNREWLQPEAVPTLVQMLMPENKPIRLLLVEMLARNPSREAGIALAQRALFDLAADVREAAVKALKDRPKEEYRDILLEGFCHPWTPVNEHAGEALVALGDKEAVPGLVDVLDKGDPGMPFPASPEKKLRVREMVRINHLTNCTLCHPHSQAATDLVRGQVPDPNQSISPGAYQQERVLTFVHADETYLRQDFSVMQPVTNPGVWPAFQRFDYLIRTRPLTLDEEIFGKFNEPSGYQRQAILFALRELTGTDAGKTATAWRRRLAEVEKHAPSGFN